MGGREELGSTASVASVIGAGSVSLGDAATQFVGGTAEEEDVKQRSWGRRRGDRAQGDGGGDADGRRSRDAP
jgi:hypothetical protein